LDEAAAISDDEDNIKCPKILAKKIVKEAISVIGSPQKQPKKRLQMEKNGRAITINTFAKWIHNKQNDVKKVYVEILRKPLPEGFFDYNYRYIDRRGPTGEDIPSTKKQYKISSVEKFVNVFCVNPNDSSINVEIKEALKVLLTYFLGNQALFLEMTRAQPQNKDYWIQNYRKIKEDIFQLLA